jgi:hypothetical protein
MTVEKTPSAKTEKTEDPILKKQRLLKHYERIGYTYGANVIRDQVIVAAISSLRLSAPQAVVSPEETKETSDTAAVVDDVIIQCVVSEFNESIN